MTTTGTPLVSVIIPTYNHARFIGEAIHSILRQTYRHWELVIVDDGSTDQTADVVRSFHDARITYVGEPHRGVFAIAQTLNVGLARTSGELVTALMSDDLWPAHRLEVQVPILADERVVLAFGREMLIDEHGREIGEYHLPRFVRSVRNQPVGSALSTLLVSNWIPQPTVLLRRAALDKIGGYLQPPDNLAEDYPTHLALAQVGEFRFVDGPPLASYRMHGAQMTRLHRVEMVRKDRDMILEFFQKLDPTMQRLSGITGDELRALWDAKLHNARFQQGRLLLLNGDRANARTEFLHALRQGNALTRLKAAAGMACSLFGTDLEWLAGVTHRPRLR